MKDLTKYILEKASFLVKKHINSSGKYSIAMSRKDLEENSIFKIKTAGGWEYLCLLGPEETQHTAPDERNCEEPITGIVVISIDNDINDITTRRVAFNCCVELHNAKYFEPTKEDIDIISIAHEYMLDNNITKRELMTYVYKNGHIEPN